MPQGYAGAFSLCSFTLHPCRPGPGYKTLLVSLSPLLLATLIFGVLDPKKLKEGPSEPRDSVTIWLHQVTERDCGANKKSQNRSESRHLKRAIYLVALFPSKSYILDQIGLITLLFFFFFKCLKLEEKILYLLVQHHSFPEGK